MGIKMDTSFSSRSYHLSRLMGVGGVPIIGYINQFSHVVITT